MTTLVQKETEQLLKEIGVEVKVTVTQEDDSINILIDSPDNALLIGKHGSTLYSLEAILALTIAQKTGEYKRILLEIGGYRRERQEYLKDLAMRLKEEVLSSGIEKSLRGLKSWERRFVHLLFQEDKDVATESEGEDEERVLVIKKK